MKTITFFLTALFLVSALMVRAEEKDTLASVKYDFDISEYFELIHEQTWIETPETKSVIIYDVHGKVRRQMELSEDIETSTPAIIRPVFDKSHFLTQINGVSYYLFDAN